ncbi:MAG: FxsA family protein [Cellvibrionaceae bacterium]
MRILFILFIVVPIVEMWVLIEVGARIGALATIGLVLLTAVIGVGLLRYQGVATLLRANQRLRSGEIPATEMGEGIFLAVGGALLLTPGFVTDSVGFACLIPGIRRWLLGRFLKHVQVVEFGPGGNPFEQGKRPTQKDSHTIEGEYRRDDE